MTDRRCKLTPEQRAELIQRRRAGVRVKVLVREYGLTESYITRIAGPIYPAMSAAARRRA